MQIVYKKIADLKKYEKNNKTHNERQVKLVAASIQEFGFKNPVIVDKDNSIIAGHGRVKAAELLKLDEVPCIVADDLTKAQIKAYRIADNKLADLGEYDIEMLQLEVQELQEMEFDVDLLGVDLGINISDIDTKDEFSLPDGDKAPFQQMTFTLADAQAEYIKERIAEVKKADDFNLTETYGNENSNGNALFYLIERFYNGES